MMAAAAGWSVIFDDVSKVIEVKRCAGKLDDQLKFAAHGLHIATQGRQVHVSLLLDL